jgi:hypothetical protein
MTYWLNWLSKSSVLETNARKGLRHGPSANDQYQHSVVSYYIAVRPAPVEMEAALKAGQVLEPVNGIHFCASVTQVDEASRPSKNGFFMAVVLLFDRTELRCFWYVPTSIMSQSFVIEVLAWSQGYLQVRMLLDFGKDIVAYSSIGPMLIEKPLFPASPTLSQIPSR